MITKLESWVTGLCAMAALFFLADNAQAQAGHPPATHAPAVIELQDQFETIQRMTFPTTNITVLTIADRKSSDLVDGWVAVLGRYCGRVDLRGMADTSSMPTFLHGWVRHEVRKTRKYSVMLDWSGKVCAEFDFKPGQPNVLVLDRDGTILCHVVGAAVKANQDALFEVVDGMLSPSSGTLSASAKP